MGRGPWTAEWIDMTLVGLVDRVMRRLRTARRVGRTVVLRLRFDDFSRTTRSYTLPESTNETRTVLAAARGLLAAAMPMIERDGVTLVGVTVANLDDDDQLVLPLDRPYAALDAVLDEVRERFGVNAITRGILLGRDQGLTVPLLPD
jgi:DNA polymerase-4